LSAFKSFFPSVRDRDRHALFKFLTKKKNFGIKLVKKWVKLKCRLFDKYLHPLPLKISRYAKNHQKWSTANRFNILFLFEKRDVQITNDFKQSEMRSNTDYRYRHDVSITTDFGSYHELK